MIQISHVSKSYSEDVPALVDVNLVIAKGEFVFLAGPSGAGKSTLLKLLLGAETPNDGQILIDGRNVSRLRRSHIPLLRRKIGVVFQDFKLLLNRSVFENVALAVEVLGESRNRVQQKTWRVLKSVGLAHKMHTKAILLSGGEQQRVAIARAIVNEPDILLADEPTGNLDPDLTLEIMKFLRQVNARGTTVIIATHDPDLLARFNKRQVVLDRGRVVADG
ncbi:MAG: cell division ATP-binding protein FtsE [Deltaproteobacteria bacterium]|nr:cell division ATP-binding protein FtsE [Deltaproteobacteria bacterium]